MKTTKRIRFITTVRSQDEADQVAAGLRIVKGCQHVAVLPDVFGVPCQVRSFWTYSPALAAQDGATVTE